MNILEAPGQIKKGAKIKIEYKGKIVNYTAKEILDPGTDREEVLLDFDYNIYFIVSMVMDGSSWAENVRFLNVEGNE